MRLFSRLIMLAVLVLLVYNLREIIMLRREVNNLKAEISGVRFTDNNNAARSKRSDSLIDKANNHAAKAKKHADQAFKYSMKGDFDKARKEFDIAKTELDISIELAKSAGTDKIAPASDSIKKLENTLRDAGIKIKGLLENLDSAKPNNK